MNPSLIKLRLFSSGYTKGNARHIHKGAASEMLVFHAIWAIIEHPALGKVMLDTGYTQRFFEATRSFPGRLYRFATPVFVKEEEYAIHQLARMGLRPQDINHLVISHFHADHIGGLKDFPDIPVWCSRPALSHALSKTHWNGVFKGILPDLLPKDLQQRAKHPEDYAQAEKIGLFTAWKWADGIWFVSLPGHCRGQLGLYLENTQWGTVFLIVDASWSSQAYRERIYPPKLVSIFIDSYKQLTNTIDALHAFHLAHPEVKILPCHCQEVADRYLDYAHD